jgi:beta-phosphoglucomutase-like phosphatase (HAD superfamily)/uncharacterized protein YdcH (DUF465 family)
VLEAGALDATHQRLFAAMLAEEVPLRPGVARVLAWAARGGVKLAIVSRAELQPVSALLRATARARAGISFDVAVLRSDVTHMAPDPEAMALAVEKLGVGPGRSVVVADTPVAAEAARGAGLPVLAFPGRLAEAEPELFEWHPGRPCAGARGADAGVARRADHGGGGIGRQAAARPCLLDLAQGRGRRSVLGSALRKAGQHRGGPPMSHTPHELADDFPQDVEKIHELKVSNPHFAKLMDDYHEVNRAVHRAETGVEPCDQAGRDDHAQGADAPEGRDRGDAGEGLSP